MWKVWFIVAFASAQPTGLLRSSFEDVAAILDEFAPPTLGASVPGGALMVQRGQDTFLHAFGTHFETHTAVAQDTLYKMYSMTKTVTATAALMCLERGMYRLDDPISNFLPGFADSQVINVVDCNATSERIFTHPQYGSLEICYELLPSPPVTVFDVLTFQTGWSYPTFYAGLDDDQVSAFLVYMNLYYREGAVSSADELIDPASTCVASLAAQYVDECAAAIGNTQSYLLRDWANRVANVPQIHQPGAQWSYGMDADILGALVEVWTSRSLAAVFQQDIFDPLGMESTFFFLQDDDPRMDVFRARFFPIVRYDGEEMTLDPNEAGNKVAFEGPRLFLSGGSGLTSSVLDWARFADALKCNYQGVATNSGIRLLSAVTLSFATEAHVKMTYGGRPSAWGLGWATSRGVDTGEWAPKTSFGWGGAASTYFRVIPEEDMVVVALTGVFPSSTLPEGSSFFRDRMVQIAQALTQGASVELSTLGDLNREGTPLRTEFFGSVRAALDAYVWPQLPRPEAMSPVLVAGGALRVDRGIQSFQHTYGYNFETRDAVEANALYKMYSMTKTVVAVSGLQLLEKGVFRLDDSIARYVPAFEATPTMVISVEVCDAQDPTQETIILLDERVVCYRLVPSNREVTIRDVFSFTTGWLYTGFLASPELFSEWEVQRVLAARAGVIDAAEALLDVPASCAIFLAEEYRPECEASVGPAEAYDLERWASRLALVPLAHQPGTWSYGLSADLLGRLVEVWSGLSLAEYMTTHIFEPLDMTDTFFFAHQEDVSYEDRRARFFPIVESDGVQLSFDPSSDMNTVAFTGPRKFYSGGGGLLSSLPDWTAYAKALGDNYNGRGAVRLLSRQTMFLATRPQVFWDAGTSSHGRMRGWGLGWATNVGQDTSLWSQSVAFGWSGAASTHFVVVPEQDLVVVSLTGLLSTLPNLDRLAEALAVGLVGAPMPGLFAPEKCPVIREDDVSMSVSVAVSVVAGVAVLCVLWTSLFWCCCFQNKHNAEKQPLLPRERNVKEPHNSAQGQFGAV